MNIFEGFDDKFRFQVNLSPNLTPARERDERLAEMFEQIVYDTIKTVGLSKIETRPR